ncbi:MAG TPA: hypothetical protein VGH38_05260, partial [Bryobacteraceae bacterium]
APPMMTAQATHLMGGQGEPPSGGKPWLSRVRRAFDAGQPEDPAAAGTAAEDLLLDLASALDSDGGMPGRNDEARAAATIVALLAFLSNGHTPTSGAFRSHVARLVQFLKSLSGLRTQRQKVVDAAVRAAAKGESPAGDWTARKSGDRWKEMERVLGV